MPTGIKLEFKNWKDAQLKQFQHLTQNLDVYEKKVRDAVHQLDLKSRQACETSEARLKDVSTQIQKTKTEVERKVRGLLEEEGKKLNVRLREIYSYLVKLAQKEYEVPQSPKGAASKAKKAAKAAGPKRTTGAKAKKPKARKTLTTATSERPTSIN